MLPPKVPNYIIGRLMGQYQRSLRGNVDLKAYGPDAGRMVERFQRDGGGDMIVFSLNSDNGGQLFVLGVHGLGGDGELG